MESPKNKSPVLTIKRAGVRHQNGQWQDFIDREQSSVDHLLRNSFATLCREFKENKNSRNHNTIGGYKINRSKRSSPGSSGKFCTKIPWRHTLKIVTQIFRHFENWDSRWDLFCLHLDNFDRKSPKVSWNRHFWLLKLTLSDNVKGWKFNFETF